VHRQALCERGGRSEAREIHPPSSPMVKRGEQGQRRQAWRQKLGVGNRGDVGAGGFGPSPLVDCIPRRAGALATQC
jgi:hypothetical protein